MTTPLTELAARLDLPADQLAMALAGPFRRAVRVHPRRGHPTGWEGVAAIPWTSGGFFHADQVDPGTRLDWHTGLAFAQDAASQVPALLLDPRPGQRVIDVCAAPGAKSTQLGSGLGDEGLLICLDAARDRRRILIENLARQGLVNTVVSPLPLPALAARCPRWADAVLADVPCSGHRPVSPREQSGLTARQAAILDQAARLVRPGGRLVYSTCSPWREENEAIIQGFLAAHPGWQVEPAILPGADADLDGLGALRFWPHRQGTEPFFACRLQAPHEGESGTAPLLRARSISAEWPCQTVAGWTLLERGDVVLAAGPQAAACALPAEAVGLILGRHHRRGFRLDPWAAQTLVERGADHIQVSHELACRLWAGHTDQAVGTGLAATEAGAPLGYCQAGRLDLPSRLRHTVA